MVNICITIFLLLFALKPLLQSSNLYWCAIYILFGVGFIAQTSTIINGFQEENYSRQKHIKNIKHLIVYYAIYIRIRNIYKFLNTTILS